MFQLFRGCVLPAQLGSHYPSNFASNPSMFDHDNRDLVFLVRRRTARTRNLRFGGCSVEPPLKVRSMSKLTKELALLLSLFVIAAMLQTFAQSLPLALC